MRSTFLFAFAILAMTITGTVQAQDCGCGGMSYGGGYGGFGSSAGTSFGSTGSYGNYGLIGPGGPNDCGRGYTNQQAASLWAGYCTESCVKPGLSGCGLFGKKCGSGGCGLKQRLSSFGYPSASGCGCSQGCFGYPCGGCGGGGGGCKIGGLLKRLLGKFHRGGAGSCHRCSLGGFSLFRGRHSGGGCGIFSKLRARKTSYMAVTTYPVQTVAVDQCGCGSSGQYFDYAVGHEYGTAGIQSSVAGELTGACSSCGDAGGYDMGLPMSYESSDFSAAPMIQQGMDLLPQM